MSSAAGDPPSAGIHPTAVVHPAAPQHFDPKFELIAGNDGFSELHLVDPHKERQFILEFRFGQKEHAGGLGHGFDNEDARHDGTSGKMALEKRLVGGNGLEPGDFLFGLGDRGRVDHQDRVTVGNGPHNLDGGKGAGRDVVHGGDSSGN
jgi:hypothetical protein